MKLCRKSLSGPRRDLRRVMRRVLRAGWLKRAALTCATALVVTPLAARCLDEDTLAQFAAQEPAPAGAAEPRLQLQLMVREALDRSNGIGAARLLADAALDDIEETLASKRTQGSISGGLGPGGSRTSGITETAATQVRASLNFSRLLYDGGRTDRLADWRTQLAESARQGQLSQQEQLALTTVGLALERSRYRMQAQVYGHHARKMACLVQALETIVRADKGRASELVQAKKSLLQAELSQTQSQSLVRQVEVRLRRLVGDGLPSVEGLATVFADVPELNQLVADVERSSDLAQLEAQAVASRRYAEAVEASTRPQVSMTAAGAANAGLGGSQGYTRNGSYSVGLAVSIPLLNPGAGPASDAARKRAAAASLQRAEALDIRRFRVAEIHEQTLASLDRAKRTAEVLRDSEQVRSFTLQQWQQLGRRSLFDVMGAESEHYNLRVAYVNALHDVQQLNANLLSLGRGVADWLR